MLFEIEKVPMPPMRRMQSEAYIKALQSLGVNDDTSLFTPLDIDQNSQTLRCGVIKTALRLGIKLTTMREYRYDCKSCGSYSSRKSVPQCNKCKLRDKGIRAWRIA